MLLLFKLQHKRLVFTYRGSTYLETSFNNIPTHLTNQIHDRKICVRFRNPMEEVFVGHASPT